MIEPITSLFRRLDTVNPGSDENDLRRLIIAWRGKTEISVARESLAEWLEISADIGRLIAKARETSTHYVWPLYLTDNGYGVAINEFKDPEDIATGYATTLHNHRYSFISIVLSGGYRQVRSEVELPGPSQAVRIYDVGEDVVMEGDIVTVDHREFHRLKKISQHTVTLVVKCPAVKRASLSVDSSTLKVTEHVPVETRVRQLVAALAPENQ